MYQYETFESFDGTFMSILAQFVWMTLSTYTTYTLNREDLTKSDVAVLSQEDAINNARALPRTLVLIENDGYGIARPTLTNEAPGTNKFQETGTMAALVQGNFRLNCCTKTPAEASKLSTMLFEMLLFKTRSFASIGLDDVTPLSISKGQSYQLGGDHIYSLRTIQLTASKTVASVIEAVQQFTFKNIRISLI